MPKGLKRYQDKGHFHFLTLSCHRHAFILGMPESRNTLQKILEETRHKYSFEIFGYVIMSNHVHLLVSEPEDGKLSTAIQVMKQRFSRTCQEEFVWEPRYHDFNVFSDRKKMEKLHYMHQNPVAAGLVDLPEQWPWSSFHVYATRKPHLVTITQLAGLFLQ